MKINSNYIKAALLFAAPDDTRHYLNGVCFDFSKKTAAMVATNGHIMIAHSLGSDHGRDGEIRVPRDALDAAVKTKAPEIDVDFDTRTINGVEFKPIDGRFPDWRRFIPRKPCSGISGQFDAYYVGLCAEAKRLIKREPKRKGHWGELNPVIAHNGKEDAAIVDFGDPEWVGVIMPMRAGDVPAKLPKWV